jgi:hypothetical protein
VILNAVYQLLRMLDPYTQGKGFGFNQDLLPVQQFKDIPGTMAGCQDEGIGFEQISIGCFNRLY